MEYITMPKSGEEKMEIQDVHCAKCGKKINEEYIINAFKITIGLIIKDNFIPAEHSVYYHQKCLL